MGDVKDVISFVEMGEHKKRSDLTDTERAKSGDRRCIII